MKIGILVGMENTFPPALIEKINGMNAGVTAEYIKVGGVKMGEPTPYRLIFDRISHDIPFFRSYLKNAVLNGAVVVNNPFWWSSDEKFFGYSLATKLGIAVPKTILLPQKSYKSRLFSLIPGDAHCDMNGSFSKLHILKARIPRRPPGGFRSETRLLSRRRGLAMGADSALSSREIKPRSLSSEWEGVKSNGS